MKFYERCLGGELHLIPFSEGPEEFSKAAKDRVLHAAVVKDGVALIMASDAMPSTPFNQGNNFSICMSPDSPQEFERLFSAFSEKGKVTMPLQDTSGALALGHSRTASASTGCSI
jgi:PhnB protein